MEGMLIDPRNERDIASLMLDDDGCLGVRPAALLATTTAQERIIFGVRNGVYGFPTTELCDFLRARIEGRTAIEIAAGTGVLAAALSIPATDNRQQEDPKLKAYYALFRQPTVRYGDHVEKLDAHAAVAKYKPQVVIASWVTHRYDPSRHDAGGSESGVDEALLIQSCDEYIVIGNQKVHAGKAIWDLPHELHTPPWLYSRAANGSPDFVAIWRRSTVNGVA